MNFTVEERGTERLSDLPKVIQFILICSRIRTHIQGQVSYISMFVNLWFISSMGNYAFRHYGRLIYRTSKFWFLCFVKDNTENEKRKVIQDEI